MAKHIGIVACSAEGAALCYRTICLESIPVMGKHNHPRITIDSIPLARYMELIERNDWISVGGLLKESINLVASGGAEFVICPDNTCHIAYDQVMSASPVPWLHIAHVVALEARERGFKKVGIFGTRYLMESDVYPRALSKYGIDSITPSSHEREEINATIFDELVNAIFKESTRQYFDALMMSMKRLGCDAVVLGCTEIPLIVKPDIAPIQTLDSTRLLAKKALQWTLQEDLQKKSESA